MASTDTPAEPSSAGDAAAQQAVEVREASQEERVPFTQPEPVREDQVSNAVKFLSHPNVKSSPITHRRAFLERKGLSKEEIDEAFRRVPDSPPNKLTSVPAAREGQLTTSNVTLGNQAQQHLRFPSQQQSLVHQPIVQARTPWNWPIIFMVVGFFATASFGVGAIVAKVLIPKFKAWVHKIILEEEDAELSRQRKLHAIEDVSALAAAIAAANSAAAAATRVAEASMEMTRSRDGDLQKCTELTKSLERSIQGLSNAVNGMKLSATSVEQAKELVRSPLDAPAADVHKVQINSSWRTLSPIEQLESREGMKGNTKGGELLQVQFGSNVTKAGTLNSNRSSISVTENVRRSASVTTEEPWWRRRTTEPGSSNVSSWSPENSVRITEIDQITDANGDSIDSSVSGSGKVTDFKESNGSVKAVRQSWVPPPVPPTIMPGATAAIRYSKTVAKDEVQALPYTKTILSDSSGTGLDASSKEPFIEGNVSASASRESPELYHQDNPLPKESLEMGAEASEEL